MLKGWRELCDIGIGEPHVPGTGNFPPLSQLQSNGTEEFPALGVGETEIGCFAQQLLERRDRTGRLTQPRLQLPCLVGERVDVESRRQAPFPVTRVQKADVPQMVVHVGDQEINDQSPPQFAQINGRCGTDPSDRIGQLGVCAILIATALKRRPAGEVGDSRALAVAIKATHDGDLGAFDGDHSGARDLAAGMCQEPQGKDLATNDRPFILEAREFTDRKSTVLLEDRALRPQSTEGRRLTQKIGQIRPVSLSASTLCAATAILPSSRRGGRTVICAGVKELTLRIEQTQRPNATEVIDRH